MRRASRCFRGTPILLCLLATAPAAWAQGGANNGSDESADLAKKLSNPVSDLVSVPFQFNWAQGVGPDNDSRFLLNIQPVMPFRLNQDWNLISRVIVPVLGQPALTPGGSAASGVGDILGSFFFSPKKGNLIWGLGPAFSLPSTSEPTLGTGKWSAGPTAVILKQSGPWTYGILVNQLWSFAGSGDRADVSQGFFQPFLTHTNAKAFTIGVNSESVANWKADSGEKWTVPINFFVSKVLSFGPFKASYQGGFGYYVEKPTGGPDWQLRATITLLLPSG